MTTNSGADKLFENDDSKDKLGKWDEMTDRARKCPGLSVLERWIEDSLDELEKDFCGFSTEKSMRGNFGR